MRRRLGQAALVLLATTGCLGGHQGQRQRRMASDLEPAALRPTPTEGGLIGTARIRVYTDEDYRAQNPGHEGKIRRLVERASHVLEPTLGLKLEVAEFRTWQRSSGDNLQGALEELEYLDPGTDVDFVLGMLDALSHVSTELHQLGRAHVLGRHLVLRGLNDSAEVSLLNQVLGTIEANQRQRLYSRRKRHKETLILLHELAHVLGGLHVSNERSILFPSYDHRQGGFGREDARLMRRVAAARFGPDARSGDGGWDDVLGYLRQHSWSGWNEDEKAILVAELESRARAGADKSATESLGDVKMRPADRERFRAAERLSASGRPLDAWEQLEPLLDYYPDEPVVQRFACRLAVAAGRDRSAVEARCARASQAAGGDAEPHLRLAQSYLASDKAKSLAEALKARELLQAPGAATPDAGAVWGDLAVHFQKLGAVTWAEEAAARATNGKAVQDWARGTRARFGLPPRGPVPPEKEGDYVAGHRDLLTLIYDRRYRDAERRAAELMRKFGGAAGLHAALCDLEIRRRNYAAARPRCREAIRRYADASWAHYLIGLLDKREKHHRAALEHLERAIALDPDLEHAYQVAAELYGELKRADDRKRIADKYREKFGRPLP